MPPSPRPQGRPLELTPLLTLLLEVSEHINSTLDLDELMARMAELVKRAIDYEVFAILLLSESTQELRVRFSVGHPDEMVSGLRIKVGEGIVGRAAQEHRSVRVNDVLKEPGYIQSLAGVRSELAVPLIAKNRVVGVIDLEARRPNFFTAQHQYLLELLASRMAMAVENARLHRRTVRQARTLKLLYEISRELSSELELKELLRKIGALTKRLIDYHRFGILLYDEQTRSLSAVISMKQDESTPERFTVPVEQGVVGAAARARETVRVPDVSQDARYISVNPDTRSELAVPLVHGDRLVGVVDLESPRVGYFTEEHARLLATLAPQMAIAIENSLFYERLRRSEARRERDLERAGEIQRHMLPALCPVIPGLETCVRFQPARELGGDLYDFVAYGKDRHGLAIGDVSGKGAPAALYGAMVNGVLRSLASLKLAPAEMLRRLNLAFLERRIEGHFTTLLYGLWEAKTRTLRLSNAGMPLPILLRDRHCHPVRVEGVPLGLLENTEYQETTLTLQSGDVLALFSDGLEEAMNARDEEFGNRRLERALRENACRPLGEICDALFADIARFEAGRPRRDDQTLLLVRVH
jgi:phosphoserine phosphatase RsbU/P